MRILDDGTSRRGNPREVLVEFAVLEAKALDMRLRKEDVRQKTLLEIGRLILYDIAGYIPLTEDDLWAIRAAVDWNMVIGKIPVGETIRMKVWKALLDMVMEDELGLPVSDLTQEELDEQRKGGPNKDPDEGTDEGSSAAPAA